MLRGGEWTDEEVVVDRNWVTSRGPRDLPAFIREFTEVLARVPQKSASER
jgi:protease I